MRKLILAALTAGILSLVTIAIATAHEDHSTDEWPMTCVDLNDIVEEHLGNPHNVGIYQNTFGDQAEAACQNDHRNDVIAVFGWAIATDAGQAEAADLELDWPTTCVELNDIVEGHLGNHGNVAIYQNTFGDQAEAACQNDHREDVRSVFAWAIGGYGSTPTPTPAATPASRQTSPETDRAALVALYNATTGPNWEDNHNWLSDAPLGEWYGVTTDGNGRVVGLNLRSNQLSGEIPPELGGLENLEQLYLDGNQLSGEIPPELGSLENLQWLNLHINELSGEIPPELGNFARLAGLNLHGNQLSGEIPPELGNLEHLATLWLRDNRLSGEIPPELGGLENLYWLYLDGNQLSGEIPPELGSLANLERLHIDGNQLSGCVPGSLEGQLRYASLGGLGYCP